MRKLSNLKSYDLFVIRFNKDGSKRISRPCELCIYYMRNQKEFKINKVYYFDDEGILKCEKLINMNCGTQSFGLKNYCETHY